MTFVSRAGQKLDHALDAFAFDVSGLTCVDFGCNVGGFTDCLLKRGASEVTAIDTGYGVLDYRLRVDPRVVVRERTNALHAEPSVTADLVTIDVAWTRQRRAMPAALAWLRSGGWIISLVKPHYEVEKSERQQLEGGRLDPDAARTILARVLDTMTEWGVRPIAATQSPLVGEKAGNVEFLVLACGVAAPRSAAPVNA